MLSLYRCVLLMHHTHRVAMQKSATNTQKKVSCAFHFRYLIAAIDDCFAVLYFSFYICNCLSNVVIDYTLTLDPK